MNRLVSWQCVDCTEAVGECPTHTPVMNRLVHTVPIDGPAWNLVLAAVATVHVVVEVETWLQLQWNRRTPSSLASSA
jgi:hypothetical protein